MEATQETHAQFERERPPFGPIIGFEVAIPGPETAIHPPEVAILGPEAAILPSEVAMLGLEVAIPTPEVAIPAPETAISPPLVPIPNANDSAAYTQKTIFGSRRKSTIYQTHILSKSGGNPSDNPPNFSDNP
ncbi:hypothetical protein EU245_11360 [Lentibacillus lipolyticus]|nr:hypothetical protein EU245_11360 [Lentibacillus lipolyticus]